MEDTNKVTIIGFKSKYYAQEIAREIGGRVKALPEPGRYIVIGQPTFRGPYIRFSGGDCYAEEISDDDFQELFF